MHVIDNRRISPLSKFTTRSEHDVQAAAARSVLEHVITLAEETPEMTDEQSRARLVRLADRTVPGERVLLSATVPHAVMTV